MLSSKLKSYVVAGDIKRKALIKATKDAADRASKMDDIRGDFKPDTILMGSTGIGKTHWTKWALDESLVQYTTIRGSSTFFNFCTNLMLAHHIFTKSRKNKEEKLVVNFDDCDFLFSNEEGRNALKEMAEKQGSRKLTYGKIVQEHLLSETQLAILDKYRPSNGGTGFSVDCNDMIFIFATNFKLPTENEANAYSKKHAGSTRANTLMSLAALRRRFTCRDFMLDQATNWGWLAYVTLNDSSLIENILGKKLYNTHKYEILNWVWNNWGEMTEHNLDTIKSLALDIKEYGPDGYIDIWESSFIDGDLLKESLIA
jgi:hypothetical protein